MKNKKVKDPEIKSLRSGNKKSKCPEDKMSGQPVKKINQDWLSFLSYQTVLFFRVARMFVNSLLNLHFPKSGELRMFFFISCSPIRRFISSLYSNPPSDAVMFSARTSRSFGSRSFVMYVSRIRRSEILL